MIHWKSVDEYVEPNWVKLGTELTAALFWRPNKGATFGYIRDGELFDVRWIFVCASSKVTHFSAVNEPGSNVVAIPETRVVP